MIHILNTRPKNTLSEIAFHLPVIEIVPVQFKPTNTDDFNYCIFLSANAVFNFFQQQKLTTVASQLIAIGPATKNALIKLGFIHIITPKTFNSEGILALPELKNINNKSVAIISGENPKPLLTQELNLRGTRVKNIFCYSRKPVLHDMNIVFPKLIKYPIDTILSASSESLFYLLQLFKTPEHRQWLLNKKISIISEKMKAEAMEAGFCDICQFAL
ncbi:MAG: hypothetical protein A3E82_01840 [Gammaproteobacteria bacterium RIFCSPHIGHO2_12_FULL_38_11]|nr:MAG: hypothetical protein A3E82_01840 [Gammaproteobacteria bacterium RIFCSPHIGHO2_12_FULL_38_11]